MTSTTTNDNSISLTQTVQHPFPASKSALTSPLASLANATEPNSSSSNQQQSSVATFPQRKTGASPTTNKESPFGGSFIQSSTTGSNTGFSFTKPLPTNSSGHFFSNTTSNNASGVSFPNTTSGNFPIFNFTNSSENPFSVPSNQSTINSQVRQPIQSFTFSSSKQQQEISIINEAAGTTQNSISTSSRKLSDPSTPISQQSGFPNQEQEATDLPASLADISLLEKKIRTKLVDSSALVIDRSDPTSPLYSLKSFQDFNLKPELLKGVYSMGFQAPSKIQEIALPHLLNNPPKNIIAQSQSGTGKTAAFSLAILSRIDPSIPSVQALILAPTFELAIQIGSVIEKMAQFLPYIKIAYAVRNAATTYVRRQLLSEPIVIGTPGTVEDWCRRQRVIDLSKLRVCCVDEADVMIATEGFQKTCVDIVRSLDPSVCQMMLFSATYSDEVMTFAREIVKDPVVLRLKREKQTLHNIRQFFIRCYDSEQKYHAIEQIYAHLILGQAMIFCRTKATARELAVRMANQQHSVRELTGALDIEQRASVIRQFRDRVFNVLISTNVTARGIDIEDVSLVINYDMPVTMDFKPDYETYLHRIGRCGRFGKLGYTFNLIGSEKDFNTMKAIEEYFHHPIVEITIDDIINLEQDQE
ncbi:unnamed protein product [Rotaria sp. Silwood1]|nr:unnamed protein product [Rotaria sp. Silwood1]CAF4917781.1 unnamed protein product [Rotaria sp. Silwood1]